jgi:ABC-2 type transport system permease protein
MNLMNSGMWGIGLGLVDLRQRKLLKRFVASPMRRGDFLLALASSRLILTMIDLAVLLGFGVLAFHMRVMGSWLSILAGVCCRRALLRRSGTAHCQPRTENRDGEWPD